MKTHCPIPQDATERISLAHGAGAKLTNALIEQVFRPIFNNDPLNEAHDAAVVTSPQGERFAISTDSFVISPCFFPGGDIGKLAVCGTVNDVLMGGAEPAWLSAGFILEEGFLLQDLKRIIESMQEMCVAAGIRLIAGDTKVVEKGSGDGLFINTTGIGRVPVGRHVAPGRIQESDVILVSGDIGRHGVAIMANRNGLSFETALVSDCALLREEVTALYAAGLNPHCMRDLTRGGLGAALVELNDASGFRLHVIEDQIPVGVEVAGACEVLGIDPIFVPCEGRFMCVVDRREAGQALDILRSFNPTSARIGSVLEASERMSKATIRSCIGVDRIIDLPSGEPLPRIC